MKNKQETNEEIAKIILTNALMLARESKNKLETLKDIEIHHQVEPVNEEQIKVNGIKFGRWNSMIIQPMDAKNLAIKWVKWIRQGKFNLSNDLTLMHIHNISEEDLRDEKDYGTEEQIREDKPDEKAINIIVYKDNQKLNEKERAK